MAFSVVIPWSPGCSVRELNLGFVKRWWEDEHPDSEVIVSAPPMPNGWVKGHAANAGVAAASHDLVILADADCLTDGIPAAIEAVADGAPWAIPHGRVFRLTEAGTVRYMESGEYGHPFDRRPYRGMAGGGFVVAPRETLCEIPLDSRYIGWGQEDESHALALRTLAGEPWRGDADLIHLFHPPEPRMSRRKGSRESWRLYTRYRAAAGDPVAMKELLKEAA